MTYMKTPQILWGANMRTYMHGSQVEQFQDGSVRFYNPLVASGTEIHSWTAIQNYQGSRTQPVLPLLKKRSDLPTRCFLYDGSTRLGLSQSKFLGSL